MTSYISKRYHNRCRLGLIDDVLGWPYYGYFAGGVYSAVVATTDRIAFSSGITIANTISNLSLARYGLAGLSDKNLYGYVAGGYGGSGYIALTDIIVFSSGVTSANTISNLSQARANLASLSDGSNYGYFAGGTTWDGVVTTDRVTFSNGNTSTNTTSNLSQARTALTGLSDGISYGYFGGGYTIGGGGSQTNKTDRITFSSGTTATNTASYLSQSRYGLTGLSDNVNYGYFVGGRYESDRTYFVSTADRITFSSGATISNTVSNLSQSREGLASSSDGINYGYFTGGGYVSTTDRIAFSSGITVANTVSNLSLARSELAGLSSVAV